MICSRKDTLDFFRFRQALAVSFATIIIIFIIVTFNISNGFTAVLAITVVPFLYQQEIMGMAWQRFLGACLGFCLGCIVFSLVHSLPLCILAFFIINLTAGCLFSLRIYPYTFLITSITFSLHFLFGFSNVNAGISFVYDWFVNAGIALLILAFVKTWVFRDRTHETFAHEKAKIIQTLKTICQHPERQTAPEYPAIKKLEAFSLLHLKKNPSYSTWTSDAKRLSRRLETICSHYPFLKSIEPLARLFDAFFHNFFSTSINETLSELDTAFETLRYQRYFKDFSTDDFLLITRLRLQCHECLREKENMEAPLNTNATSVQSFPSISSDQLRPALIKSFKISLALFVGTIFALYTGVVGGIQTLFTISLFFSQPTLGKASLWTLMRLGGTCIGAALSVIYLIILSHLPHLWVMISLYSFSILILYYIGYSSSSYGYMFLQIGVALTLIFLIDLDTIADINIVGKRFVGIIEGCAIGIVLNYLIAVETPLKGAQKACSKQLQLIADYLRANFIENKSQKTPTNLIENVNIRELNFTFGIDKSAIHLLDKRMNAIQGIHHLFELLSPSHLIYLPKLKKEETRQLQKGVLILIQACENKLDPKEVLYARDIFRTLLTSIRHEDKTFSWPIAHVSLLFDLIFTLEETSHLLYQAQQNDQLFLT